MKKKRFQVGESFYEIPDNEVDSFLSDNPKAVEVKYYELDGGKYNIPIAEVDAFENEMGLKKKVGGRLSLVGGAVGNAAPKSEKQKIADYLYGLKSKEEQQLAAPSGGITTTLKQKPKKVEEAALNTINTIMYEDSDRWKDPVKSIVDESKTVEKFEDLDVYNKAAEFTRNSLAGSGYKAKVLFADSFSNAGKDNMTASMVKNRADKYDQIAQPFRDLTFTYGNQEAETPENDYTAKDKIYDAAIRAYANKNPLFKRQAEAAGVDLASDNLKNKLGDKGTAGIAMSEILMDDDFVDFVQNENPKYLNITKDIADNLLSDNREYGINVVANEISRARQKKGFNNPIVEFDDKRFKDETDLVAEQLYANDPQKMKIYQEVISQNPDKYIDTPSLLEGFSKGAEGVYKGVGNTFEAPFNSIPQQIKEGWEREASHVTADPKGVSKFLSGTGHVLGLVSALGGVNNVLGAGGAGVYSKNVAPLLAGTVPFAGDFWKESVMKYPDSPTKAALSTTLNTALYGALSQRIFPAKEVQQAFSKVKPEIAQIVENLSSGKITREVARQKANTLIRQGFDFLKGATSKSAKISAELTGIAAANRALDKLFMDEQDFEKYHPEEELQDSFKTLFLDNLVLGGMTTYSGMTKGNAIVEESIYEAATNPLRYKRVIDEMEVKDPSISKDNMLSNLGFLSILKIELDKRGVSEKNQKRYLFEAMKERAIKQQISEMPESNITRRGQEQIKRGEEIKDAILNGEDAENVLTEADRKEADENNKAQAEKNKLTEKGQRAVDKLLEQKDEPIEIDQDRDLMDESPDDALLADIQSRSEEGVKDQDLQFFVDQAANAPNQFIERYGEETTMKLLEKATDEQLKEGMKNLYKFDENHPGIEILDTELAKRENGQDVSKPQTTEIKPAETQSSEVLNNLSKSDRETGTIALFESGLSIEEGEQLVEEIKNGNVTVNNLHTRLNVPINTLFFAKKLLTEGKLADALGKAIEIKKSQKETVIDIEEQNKKSITINEKFINELKQKRDSEDFKYIIVEESDVLGNRKKVKRLKTKQELEESTKKINDAINKAEKENEKLKLQLKEQPKPAEPIEEDMTAFVEVTRPELGFEELPTDILDNMDSKTMAVQGKRLEGLNKNLSKLQELFNCIWT